MIRADILADGAWEELRRALGSYIGRRVADRADRDDLVQEVLLRIVRGAGGLRQQASPGPWVYAIANGAVIDHWRRAGRHRAAASDLGRADFDEIAGPQPNDDGLQQALAAFVASRVAHLPSPYRETLTLTELQGIRQADAAAMLDVSLAAVKSRVLRGRALLREAIEACCELELGPTGRVVECAPRSGRDVEACGQC